MVNILGFAFCTVSIATILNPAIVAQKQPQAVCKEMDMPVFQ